MTLPRWSSNPSCFWIEE